MLGEVEIRQNSTRTGVSITDMNAKEKFRKAAMDDLLASVQARDEEAVRNKKDCFKRPL